MSGVVRRSRPPKAGGHDGTSLDTMTVLVTGESSAPWLDGRDVQPFVRADGSVVAVVDRSEVWVREKGSWRPRLRWDGAPLNCLADTPDGLLAGTAEAHLLHEEAGAFRVVESFDDLAEASGWYTPWGGPPDVRSIAVAEGVPYVNVHVGGVARPDGDGWRPLIDIDVDVHQIVVAPDGSLLVATGAAGFGRSIDGGATWDHDAKGLHGSYCRAVAVAGEHVLVTASSGPHSGDGALYRRPLGSRDDWERCAGPLPDRFDGNVDTFWLAARGAEAAVVGPDGSVFRSDDEGATWAPAGRVHSEPRGLVLAAA